MAKSKAKASQTLSDKSALTAESHKRNLKKKKKKILFWKKKMKGAEKKTQKDPEKMAELPPKTAEEVSTNWKALQELLKRKEPLAIDRSSKKKKAAIRAKGAAPTSKEEAEKGANGAFVKLGPAKSRGKTARKRPALDQESGRRKGGRRSLEAHQGPEAKGPPEPRAADIWFDDVDPDDIEAALGPEAARVARKNLGIKEEETRLEKEGAFEGLTKVVSLDCEMVGTGPNGEDSVAARVSLVNRFGHCIYDKFVRPNEKVTDFRTNISGIRPEHLKAGEDFKVVQAEVASILKGRILVGHAVHNDLKILFLDHPKKKTRDTQKYKPFRQQVKSGRPSLKLLCEKLLNVRVQVSEHSSVQDAQAAMRLYVMVKREWEASLREKKQQKQQLPRGKKD